MIKLSFREIICHFTVVMIYNLGPVNILDRILSGYPSHVKGNVSSRIVDRNALLGLFQGKLRSGR